MLSFEPLAKGRLLCIVPLDHPLAKRSRISAAEIVTFPMIGIDPAIPMDGSWPASSRSNR